MKKMCQYYDGCPCDKTGHSFYHCPKNTNSKCEIIPKKPKTRKIKAGAFNKAAKKHHGKFAFLNVITEAMPDKEK